MHTSNFFLYFSDPDYLKCNVMCIENEKDSWYFTIEIIWFF